LRTRRQRDTLRRPFGGPSDDYRPTPLQEVQRPIRRSLRAAGSGPGRKRRAEEQAQRIQGPVCSDRIYSGWFKGRAILGIIGSIVLLIIVLAVAGSRGLL
jgi:hypothetical protein